MIHVDCWTAIPLDLFNELKLAGAGARIRGQHILRRKHSHFGMRSQKHLMHPSPSLPEGDRTISHARGAVLGLCFLAALAFSPDMLRIMSWMSSHNVDRARWTNLGSFFQLLLSKGCKMALDAIVARLSETVGGRERTRREVRHLIQLVLKLGGVGVSG